MRRRIDDETLMAWLDGELDAIEAERVRRQVAGDTRMQARAARFRESADALRGAFDAPLREPVPPRLLRALGVTPAPAGAGRWRVPAALAAGVLLTLAATLGYRLHDSGEADDAYGMLLQARAAGVQRALETAPSGSPRAWRIAGGELAGEITPLLSFSGAHGRPCREYRLTPGAGSAALPALAGIACREPGGRWSVEVAVVEAPTAAAGDGPGYAPAGGAGPARGERLLDDLIPADTLSPEEEARMLRHHWGAGP